MEKTMTKGRGVGPKFARSMPALVAATVLLSGCVTGGAPGFGGPQARAPAIDGTWGDTGGVATSSLVNGRFVSIANDTGNRVAEGTYVYTGENSISLDFFSLLRQTRTRANCVLASQNTLNCTNDSGQQFQLFRRAAVS